MLMTINYEVKLLWDYPHFWKFLIILVDVDVIYSWEEYGGREAYIKNFRELNLDLWQRDKSGC